MRKFIRLAFVLVLLLLAAPYVLTLVYAGGHPVSTLMLWRWMTGAPVTRQWIDFKNIAPVLPRTVIASEDARFCSHHGVDWDAVRDVLADAEDGDVGRGGSTITQQVAKNLFLWSGRSYVRKGLELPLALWIDLVLPKQRVLELYLNIAEWGPSGQFGVNAGANHAFGRSAENLSAREAALLAAMLPNPYVRSARKPGPGMRRLAGTYMARARSVDLAVCRASRRDS